MSGLSDFERGVIHGRNQAVLRVLDVLGEACDAAIAGERPAALWSKVRGVLLAEQEAVRAALGPPAQRTRPGLRIVR